MPAAELNHDTLSAVQEWFNLISQYPNWYHAEMTAKLALTSYPAY